MHGKSLLPPWPLRVACNSLNPPTFLTDEQHFEAVREAIDTVLNNTGRAPCYDAAASAGSRLTGLTMRSPPRADRARTGAGAGTSCKGDWGYQWCTEMVQPFTSGTSKDFMFCPDGTYLPKQDCSKWDVAAASRSCDWTWGVTPRVEWARIGQVRRRTRDGGVCAC